MTTLYTKARGEINISCFLFIVKEKIMRDGICPKCGSDEIYKKKTGGVYAIHISIWRRTHFMIYACSECGFCEQYIEDSLLSKINKKWTPVNQKRKRKDDEG